MTYKARIKFDNREWLVVDNIECDGVKYYYIIEDISEELEKLEKVEDYKGKVNIEFIYKLDNGNYKNVIDQALISRLNAIVATRVLNSEEKQTKKQ